MCNCTFGTKRFFPVALGNMDFGRRYKYSEHDAYLLQKIVSFVLWYKHFQTSFVFKALIFFFLFFLIPKIGFNLYIYFLEKVICIYIYIYIYICSGTPSVNGFTGVLCFRRTFFCIFGLFSSQTKLIN